MMPELDAHRFIYKIQPLVLCGLLYVYIRRFQQKQNDDKIAPTEAAKATEATTTHLLLQKRNKWNNMFINITWLQIDFLFGWRFVFSYFFLLLLIRNARQILDAIHSSHVFTYFWIFNQFCLKFSWFWAENWNGNIKLLALADIRLKTLNSNNNKNNYNDYYYLYRLTYSIYWNPFSLRGCYIVISVKIIFFIRFFFHCVYLDMWLHRYLDTTMVEHKKDVILY